MDGEIYGLGAKNAAATLAGMRPALAEWIKNVPQERILLNSVVGDGLR
jgi:hypothetical protein